MKKRIVVTGMSVFASNGNTIDEFWKSCIGGKSGIENIKSFDTSEFDMNFGGEVKNFDPAAYVLPSIYRKVDRFAQFGVCSAKMALDDSGLVVTPDNAHKIGVVIGSGLGGMLFHEEQIIEVVQNGGPKRIMASSVPRISPNSVSGYIAIASGIKGPNLVISTACSSGANAIGQALLLLRSGIIDCCVTGGVEAPITPVTVAAYQALRCLAKLNSSPQEASRPFDKTRNGFVIGEGAGILVLETLESAERRKAKIYAELMGYGSNCGAYNMVAPQPDGLDAAECIKLALKDADISAGEVNYINAHGTGTQYNDVAETKAVKEAFGESAYKIPISSIKSMVGHSIGAAGAIEAVASVLTLMNQEIPPTINLYNPDVECDLDYVPNFSRKSGLDTVISNSFGFGSNNVVLVFRKAK